MTYSQFAQQAQSKVQEAIDFCADQRSNGTPNCADLAAFYGNKLWEMMYMLNELGSNPGQYAVTYPEGMTQQDFTECTCEQGEEPREE